jgi:hypothetical protein
VTSFGVCGHKATILPFLISGYFFAGNLKVNSATVVPGAADGSVTNGVVHAIDTVLIPPALQQILDQLTPRSSDGGDMRLLFNMLG